MDKTTETPVFECAGSMIPVGGFEAVVTKPHLYGDGVHDDTEAVQWYLDHHVPLPPAPISGSYLVDHHRLRLPDGMGLVKLAAEAARDFECAR